MFIGVGGKGMSLVSDFNCIEVCLQVWCFLHLASERLLAVVASGSISVVKSRGHSYSSIFHMLSLARPLQVIPKLDVGC